MVDAERDWFRNSYIAAGLLVLIGVIGLAACDQMPTRSTLVERGGLKQDSTVRLKDMTPDESLLPPPETPGEISGAKNAGRSDKSPYGCVLSTPNLEGEKSYKYKSIYTFFPKRVVEAAGTNVRTAVFLMSSRSAYAKKERQEAHVLRHARCRLPDLDEAERLLRRKLERLPRPSRMHSQEETTRWDGMPVDQFTPVGDVKIKKRGMKKVECAEYTLVLDYCVTAGGETTCYYEVYCTRYVTEDDPGDGGGGGESGDDPDGCNTDGGASDDLCVEGGGSIDDPDSIQGPCDADNPPDYCDEAGSCYDKTISNSTHREMLRAAERFGALQDLWQQSKPDAAPTNRLERIGVVRQMSDGTYTALALPPQAYAQTGDHGGSCRVGVYEQYIPDDAVVLIHTQPYFVGESNPCRSYEYNRDLTTADYTALSQAGVDIGIMIDGEGFKFYGNTHETYSRCGY